MAAMGGIRYFLEPHILSSGRNVLSNHNTANSLIKNPVAQEPWLEKIPEPLFLYSLRPS